MSNQKNMLVLVRGSFYNMLGPARAGLGYNMVGPVPLKYENRPKINRKQASRTPPEPYIFSYFIKQNGHETDLEMSPGPLDTTIFEKKRIRTSCKRSHRSEPGLKIRL